MVNVTDIENLLAFELRDLYSAEIQVIKSLPKMAEIAVSDDLNATLDHHLKQSINHARRLKEICNDLNIKPKGRKCVGMQGILAKLSEHYEIAAYGTARAHARQLGFVKVADVLGKTLEEEKHSEHRLTVLAENKVNVQASMSKIGVRENE
jgi:ferritin-like metal-binding protein YciE